MNHEIISMFAVMIALIVALLEFLSVYKPNKRFYELVAKMLAIVAPAIGFYWACIDSIERVSQEEISDINQIKVDLKNLYQAQLWTNNELLKVNSTLYQPANIRHDSTEIQTNTRIPVSKLKINSFSCTTWFYKDTRHNGKEQIKKLFVYKNGKPRAYDINKVCDASDVKLNEPIEVEFKDGENLFVSITTEASRDSFNPLKINKRVTYSRIYNQFEVEAADQSGMVEVIFDFDRDNKSDDKDSSINIKYSIQYSQ